MSFHRITGAFVLAATLALSANAQAQTIELKLSHFVPPNHTFHKWAVAWGEQLAKESGGRLKLTIYPAGQLVGPPNRQFDATRNAIVDMSFTLHGVTPGRYPIADLTNLPFSFPSAGRTSAVMSKRLSELAPTYLAQEHQGLRILWMAVAPPVVFNSKVAVRKIEDFKGMKVRYAGAENKKMLDALGAVPLLVPPPEAQDALAKGIVDSALFPYEAALSFDLGSVTKYAIEPGISSASFALVMNPAKYGSLPDDLKALIDKTTGAAGAEGYGKAWDEAEKHGKAQLVAKGLEVITLPDADVKKIKDLAAPQIKEAIAAIDKQGKPGRAFYDAYVK
jgi:TRAP-type C4-dicarboxylate transport system substrate-binding protein